MICNVCQRGREACEYCHNLDERDFAAICDCGLYDLGSHLLDCRARANKRWLVASDYASAEAARG